MNKQLIVVGAVGLIACSGEHGSPNAVQGLEVEPPVPKDWVGYKLDASPGKWRDMGVLETAEGDAVPMPGSVSDSLVSIPNQKPSAFLYFDRRLERLYEVEMEKRDLDRVASALEAAGFAAEHRPRDTKTLAEDQDTQKAWSNSSDDRTHNGLAVYPLGSSWPLDAIGAIKQKNRSEGADGHCTGAFIGDGDGYYVITAAHCIWALDRSYLDPDWS